MRFAMLRNYLAFLRSHGVRWGDNTREVLWCGLSKVSERRGRDVREREQKRERERETLVARERKSLRNRCPSGQKAFIVLFRSYGRRHKRGRPNSYGCRFVQRTRPIANRENRRPPPPPPPPRSKSHETPTKHATSSPLYEPPFLETVETSLKRIRDKKETERDRAIRVRSRSGM